MYHYDEDVYLIFSISYFALLFLLSSYALYALAQRTISRTTSPLTWYFPPTYLRVEPEMRFTQGAPGGRVIRGQGLGHMIRAHGCENAREMGCARGD
jgi:hypothetical protein